MANENKPIGCFLCEDTETVAEFRIRGEDKSGYILAECVLQSCDIKNRNRRLYKSEEMRRAIMSPRVQELVRTGLLGEAGHPTSQEIARQSKIDPRYVQVWHKKVWMDEGSNLVRGLVTGASNDLGRSFNEDLRRGQLPAFSLRAIGSLVNEGGTAVVRNLNIVTWDRVYFPSHKEAYVTKLVATESATMGDAAVLGSLAGEKRVKVNQAEVQMLTEAGNCVDGSPLVIPLTHSEVANYLVHESENIQTAISTFDVLYESIQLNPSLNTVTMKTRMGDTFHICLEEAVKREVLDGISRFF